MKEKYNAVETSVLVGISLQTLNYWYLFKRENPKDKLAKMLPDYIQEGARQTRYWKADDIFKIVEFKNAIPRGRNGVLGVVTQRYRRKTKKKHKK